MPTSGPSNPPAPQPPQKLLESLLTVGLSSNSGAHLGKTDLVSVAKPLPKIQETFLIKQDKNILFLAMKYWTREIGVYGKKMVLHISNLI